MFALVSGQVSGRVVILGLTGSIAMGKTTVASCFRRFGVPVHDADAAVHAMMNRRGEAVTEVIAAFPEVAAGDAVDRMKLGRLVFREAASLARLERLLHPKVRVRERRFLEIAARHGHSLVVLDIPLLFETGGETRCDAVITVSAPARIQAARFLSRRGMFPDRLADILSKQWSDREKRRRANFVVQTGLGRLESLRATRHILTVARKWEGRHWPPRPLILTGAVE
jgi:dephospho-CoA kinase